MHILQYAEIFAGNLPTKPLVFLSLDPVLCELLNGIVSNFTKVLFFRFLYGFCLINFVTI